MCRCTHAHISLAVILTKYQQKHIKFVCCVDERSERWSNSEKSSKFKNTKGNNKTHTHICIHVQHKVVSAEWPVLANKINNT